MFILEESQLLEDLISDQEVLKLYETLRKQESSNERLPLLSDILASDKCIKLTTLLLEFYNSNGFSIEEPVDTKCRFSIEQRDELCQKLNLDINNIAPLALIASATMTQLFVIDNYLGPTTKECLSESYENLPQVYRDLSSKVDYKALSQSGCEIHHKTTNPWLLRTVQLYWNLLNNMGCSRRLLELEFLVWKHRYLTIYLMVLLEPCESVTSELRKIQEFIFDHHILNDAKDNNTQLVRFNTVELCCELIESSLLRGSVRACRRILDYGCEHAGIKIEHTGVLGKRTKFQQRDIPQLVIKVSQNQDGDNVNGHKSEDVDKTDLPKDIPLDDDTLLANISFVTDDDNADSVDPSPEAQLLMLTKLEIMLQAEVMEESLKDEWTLAYLRSIITTANSWCLRHKALALRSQVERKHMRKMDRALMQMEDLIKLFENPNDVLHKRARSFYSILPQSNWQLQRSLGDISLDLALFKNALEMYTRIEYWDGIIKCYCALGQTEKAKAIIHQELNKHETPYLLCLLGDATDDKTYYERAWTLSNCRFARAKKSIGTYYYVRKQYPEAIENYEEALAVNPSNISILSLLAYSCLTIERYERAAECYRNITNHDDGNFLAWNNLSKAYIKLNQKERAWRTLREAIKCNYEEWKIWENFMVVSAEIGALDDVITAWHRIIDIKSSHKDDQILSRLTHSLIIRDLCTIDEEYTKLLGESLKLVARLISTSDCSPRVWICYYKLLIKEYELSTLDSKPAGNKPLTKSDIDSRISKITNALRRSLPLKRIAETDWLQTPSKIDRVLDDYDELIDCYLYALHIMGPKPELWSQWKNFKLSINNTMKTLHMKGYASTSE